MFSGHHLDVGSGFAYIQWCYVNKANQTITLHYLCLHVVSYPPQAFCLIDLCAEANKDLYHCRAISIVMGPTLVLHPLPGMSVCLSVRFVCHNNVMVTALQKK